MSLLSQVPEIRAAIAEEAETRDAAFLEARAEIAGVAVLPLTLRRYLLLCASENAFVSNGAITPVETARFLWCVSPRYNAAAGGLPEFIAEVGRKNYGEVIQGISDYLAFSFFDAPAGGSENGEPPPSYYSFAAIYLDLFGREYGWNYADVMDAPLAVLFQLVRRIAQRNDSRAILFNPLSDRAKSEYAARLDAEARQCRT